MPIKLWHRYCPASRKWKASVAPPAISSMRWRPTPHPPPTYKVQAGRNALWTLCGPGRKSRPSCDANPSLFRGANYCASCHFDKVKDVTQKDLPGEILQGTICQDCHMEPSTGSSTSKRGAMTRAIGRHWFRGVVIPGTLLEKSQPAGRMDAAHRYRGNEIGLRSRGNGAGEDRQPASQFS